MVDRYLTHEFQGHAAEGNHRRCVSIIAEMEVLTFAIVSSSLHSIVLHIESIRTSKEYSFSSQTMPLDLIFFRCVAVSSVLRTHLPQASDCGIDAAAYGALLHACALSPEVSPPHDWALSTLETMQVMRNCLLQALQHWLAELCVRLIHRFAVKRHHP